MQCLYCEVYDVEYIYIYISYICKVLCKNESANYTAFGVFYETATYKHSVLAPFCAGYSIFVDVIDHFLCFREYVKWYFLGVCFYSEERFFLIFLWNASFFCHKHVETVLCEVVNGNLKVANRFSFFASHFFNAFVGYT